MASCGGGKPGCFGIKGVQIYGNKQSQSNLFAKAAELSSSVPIIKSYLKETGALFVSEDAELSDFSSRNENQSNVAIIEKEKDQFFRSDQSINSSDTQQFRAILDKANQHTSAFDHEGFENEELQDDKKPSYVQSHHLGKISSSRGDNAIGE